MTSSQPRRVLHVVGGMNRGGVETWLMHVLRNSDRNRLQFDFLVHTHDSCAYDREIEELGARIFRTSGPANLPKYAAELSYVLRNEGPYDAVHSHVHHFSGFVLLVAKLLGVPVRIAHSHTDSALLERTASPGRRFYLTLMQRTLYGCATTGLAASGKAAIALFGADWERDRRWAIHYCGIDLNGYDSVLIDRVKFRDELGIPKGAVVVGHVGRFVEVKNHRFLVEVATALVKRIPEFSFLLVGEGPLRSEVERQVMRAGLHERFIFTGLREDVSRLMTGAMDVFLFPSLLEGLPLVLIEAQAAGLPCIISDAITPEVIAVPSLVRQLSLANSADDWAQAVVESHTVCTDTSKSEALRTISSTPFHIAHSVQELERIYGEIQQPKSQRKGRSTVQ